MSMTRRTLVVRLVGGGVCALLLVLAMWKWISLGDAEYERLSPTGEKQRLEGFLRSVPQVQGIYRFQLADNKVYIEVVGKLSPEYLLPSGFPVYIFDETGALVYWTPDSGEDTAFETNWGERLARRSITRDEAIAITQRDDE